MKHEFIKEYGKLQEKLVIEMEPKWVYIKYNKGNFEKAAYTLINATENTNNFIVTFIDDFHVSDELKTEVTHFLSKEKATVESNFQEFINFLATTLSLHLVIGTALGLSIYGGYQLGAKIDVQLNIYPAFTLTGVFFGIAIGSITGYFLMIKYLGNNSDKGAIPRVKSETRKKIKSVDLEWPSIITNLAEIREAVRKFAADLPTGVNRTMLIKNDYSIDLEQLAPYLGGIPTKPYYMSKETYNIYEENEKDIPLLIDKVQKSVNMFYKVNNRYPIRPYDSLYRVNFHQLVQGHYLDAIPPIDFYFTDYDGLITHLKPNKKLVGG